MSLFKKAILKRLLCIFFILLLGSAGKITAQQGQDYVYAFQDTMNLKLMLANRGLVTQLRNVETGSRTRLAPNQQTLIGIGAYFWNLSVKLYLPLPVSWFYTQANQRKSRIIDLRASLYRKNWVFEGSLQRYDNIYPQRLNQTDRRNTQDKPEEIFARSIITHATYLFSGEQVSLKSAFGRNIVQTRSGGSWMMTTGFSSLELQGQESLLPQPLRSNLGKDSLISEMSAVAVEFQPGYAYNFILDKFFLHASASAGAALQYKLFKVEQRRETAWGVAPVYNVRAALGYDNTRFFIGLSGILHQAQLNVQGLQLRQNTRSLQLFMGYRFTEPKWLKRLKPPFIDL